MNELIKQVEQWSKDKGLDNGNSFTQYAKSSEEKLSEQYNKMLEERNSLIDDLSWYRAKVSRLERENEKYDKQFTDYIDETNVSLNLLSEFSQHIGNKPSSSTYKYFRAKLDNLNITEDK